MLGELFAAMICGAIDGCFSSGSNTSRANHKKSSLWSFEESGSVYDHHGVEHIVDDDYYCEDCDDYHDDYDFE
ncbi:MAG: hypothetical protein IJ331_07640 [Ruminococcus sp.]|nr:hypothetical protein [Ruminococcus sp.]